MKQLTWGGSGPSQCLLQSKRWWVILYMKVKRDFAAHLAPKSQNKDGDTKRVWWIPQTENSGNLMCWQGMMLLALSAAIPSLRPPPCPANPYIPCQAAYGYQIGGVVCGPVPYCSWKWWDKTQRLHFGCRPVWWEWCEWAQAYVKFLQLVLLHHLHWLTDFHNCLCLHPGGKQFRTLLQFWLYGLFYSPSLCML